MPVSVRVGQAVDVVGQAGRPKTITGFATHTTPVLLAYEQVRLVVVGTKLPLWLCRWSISARSSNAIEKIAWEGPARQEEVWGDRGGSMNFVCVESVGFHCQVEQF